MLLEAASTDGVEKAQSAEAIDVASVFCHFEGDFDVGLSAEVIDLGRLDLCDDVDEIRAVAQVAVV
jgi:hypothetical protein